MFDLYQGSETAAHRQAHLLNEVAADRLARSAKEGHQPSTSDRPSPAQRVTLIVTDVLSAITDAIHVAGRHPRWS